MAVVRQLISSVGGIDTYQDIDSVTRQPIGDPYTEPTPPPDPHQADRVTIVASRPDLEAMIVYVRDNWPAARNALDAHQARGVNNTAAQTRDATVIQSRVFLAIMPVLGRLVDAALAQGRLTTGDR